MSKIAFVFPGQGAQYTGMAKDFYEKYAVSRKVFENASKASGLDVEALCFEENDRLNITEYTQIAMLTAEIAILKAVEEAGIRSQVNAGLSLGEYGALVMRVTRMMIESTDISFRDVPRRYAYQIKYLTMVLVVSSILLIRAATPEALEEKERLWRMFKQEKPWLYRDVSHTMLGWLIQRDSAAGRRLLSLLYTISQRIFSFN